MRLYREAGEPAGFSPVRYCTAIGALCGVLRRFATDETLRAFVRRQLLSADALEDLERALEATAVVPGETLGERLRRASEAARVPEAQGDETSLRAALELRVAHLTAFAGSVLGAARDEGDAALAGPGLAPRDISFRVSFPRGEETGGRLYLSLRGQDDGRAYSAEVESVEGGVMLTLSYDEGGRRRVLAKREVVVNERTLELRFDAVGSLLSLHVGPTLVLSATDSEIDSPGVATLAKDGLDAEPPVIEPR